jgi:hypothetical protein
LVRFGEPYMKVPADNHNWQVTQKNLIESCIYFTVRKVIPATWLNDRDQFLYPNDGWKKDVEFQNDCLTYTLFNNNIQSKHGENKWIPFTEYEVEAKEKFASNFMTDFMNGKEISETIVSEALLFYEGHEFGGGGYSLRKKIFSQEAKAVFKAGGDLWRHYHKQPNINANASLYDIREHFQKRNEKGILNTKSKDDEIYNELIGNLRSALNLLAEKIEPKVYEYGFLMK